MKYDETDFLSMVKTTWAESRGEPYLGQVAVAFTILNRANRRAFAGELAGQVGSLDKVCQAPWQFSCWNSDDPNLPKLLALNARGTPQAPVCEDVLAGRVADTSHGALFYHAKQIMPYWAPHMRLTAAIGNHIFYTNENPKRPVLTIGSKGEYVSKVQRALGVIPATGLYDSGTFDAVRSYQNTHQLTIDGIVGDQTYNSLRID